MTLKSTTTPKLRMKQFAVAWTPHKKQRDAVKWLLEHTAAGVFADPGVGKTSITLAAFSFLHKRKIAKRALIIAPRRVCYRVWPAEIAKWKDFSHLKVEVLHGNEE